MQTGSGAVQSVPTIISFVSDNQISGSHASRWHVLLHSTRVYSPSFIYFVHRYQLCSLIIRLVVIQGVSWSSLTVRYMEYHMNNVCSWSYRVREGRSGLGFIDRRSRFPIPFCAIGASRLEGAPHLLQLDLAHQGQQGIPAPAAATEA